MDFYDLLRSNDKPSSQESDDLEKNSQFARKVNSFIDDIVSGSKSKK